MTLGVVLTFALIAFAAIECKASDQCDGPLVKISLPSGSKDYYGILNALGVLSEHGTGALPLLLVEPSDGCSGIDRNASGAVLLLERGNCTFTQKVNAAAAANASALLLYDNQPGCVNLAFEAANLTAAASRLPAVSITMDAGVELAAALRDSSSREPLLVQLQPVPFGELDGAAAVLWVMAVLTLTAGALWSGQDYMAEKRGALREDNLQASTEGMGRSEVISLNATSSVAFVFIASALLLLLFFFFNQSFFYVLLVVFCFASAQALTAAFGAGLIALLPRAERHVIVLPLLGPIAAVYLVATLLSLAIVITYAVWRAESWSWVLQDTAGVAVMVMVLRLLRVDSLRTACLLLPACFAYDVFWVFLQPLIFGGTSVMVQVAQGVGSNEYMPMLLRVPRLSHPELGGYSMLGFGDVILPGLLACLMRRTDLDLRLGVWRGYFAPTVLAYGAGLLVTYVALLRRWGGDQGQPALLYLVPFTLGTVLLLGGARGQLRALFAIGQGGSSSGSSSGSAYAKLDSDDRDPESGATSSPPPGITRRGD